MQWSNQQEKALADIKKWRQSGDPLFKLFGYAGTGKTTLAKQIAEDVGGNVLFGAFTGKAAFVLREKGCNGASTIHSMIYTTTEKSKQALLELKSQLAQLVKKLHDEKKSEKVGLDPKLLKLKRQIDKEETALEQPYFRLNPSSEAQYASLIIIDECSMVGKQMGQDLLSFGVPVLVLGDPAQLPPVGDGGFFTNGKPHNMLTDIHRQAEDNPIIKIATDIRTGQSLSLGNYGHSSIINRSDVDQSMILESDQVLVGRNNTRQACNIRIRELLNFTEALPQVSDKLVCLRNNHDLGFLNGSLWNVDAVENTSDEFIDFTVSPLYDIGEAGKIATMAHTKIFTKGELKIPWWARKLADEFDYGYALTCHKAQGSQWEKVFVFDESAAFRNNAARWLYTAVTRASEKVTIVKGY